MTKMYGQSYGKTHISITAMTLKRGHVMCSQKSLPGASLQPLVKFLLLTVLRGIGLKLERGRLFSLLIGESLAWASL